jgi:hypothetical protein
MENASLGAATLRVTKDGVGFKKIELKNQKHALRK